jgi:hypothetical protein
MSGKKNPGPVIQTSGTGGAGGTSVFINNTLDNLVPVSIVTRSKEGVDTPLSTVIKNNIENAVNTVINNSSESPVKVTFDTTPASPILVLPGIDGVYDIRFVGQAVDTPVFVQVMEIASIKNAYVARVSYAIANKDTLINVVNAINAKILELNSNPGFAEYTYETNVICCFASADAPLYSCIMNVSFYSVPTA